MAAGAILVMFGFLGLAFRQNRNAEPDEDNMKQAVNRRAVIAAGNPATAGGVYITYVTIFPGR
jgi:hypothetical protein